MRIVTFAITALVISFLSSQSAHAEPLNGEQIKSLLIGNTTYRATETRSGNDLKIWDYYKSDSTRSWKVSIKVGRGGFRNDAGVADWRVTKDGKYCATKRTSQGGPDVNCYRIIRVTGDTIQLKGVDGAKDHKVKLLKGNPEGL